MGEDPMRVFNSGAPGIDNILSLKLLDKKALETEINWKFASKSALFTYHPPTLEDNDLIKDLQFILEVIQSFSINVLFTYANADAGGNIINEKLEQFCELNPSRYKVVKSLGQLKYLSAMKWVDFLIGNSSSGIIEAASFKKPFVNIGIRQKGRLRSENVIDCDLTTLRDSIKLASSDSFKNKIKNVKNIYGDGTASSFIVDKLINEPVSVIKKFKDIH